MKYEMLVRYNLADSGITPICMRELFSAAGSDPFREYSRLLDVPLGYGETNGYLDLRQQLAVLYPGCGADQILITTGGIEALFLVLNAILEAGDRVVIATPSHEPLINGLIAIGCEVVEWRIQQADQRRFHLESLPELAGPGTKLILLNSPHNPTGAALSQTEMDQVLGYAESINCWVINDEVYRDLPYWVQSEELAGPIAGRAKRISIGSLSKSLGLPGLRVGWLAGPSDVVSRCWEMRGYTTLSPSRLSQSLAMLAFRAKDTLLVRAKSILKQNYDAFSAFVERRSDLLRWLVPQAGSIALMDYVPRLESDRLAAMLAEHYNVLVIAGSIYGERQALRIGLGSDTWDFTMGLSAIEHALDSLSHVNAPWSPSPVLEKSSILALAESLTETSPNLVQ